MGHTEITNALRITGLPRETIYNLPQEKVLLRPSSKDHCQQDQSLANNLILRLEHIFASQFNYFLAIFF